MKHSDLITSFVSEVLKPCKLDRRIKKTIIAFLSAAVLIQTLIPTFVGRRVKGRNKAPRDGIKRIHRLLKNKHIKLSQLNMALKKNFLRMIGGRKSIVLIIDWTFIRDFCFLSVSLGAEGGRSLPICFWGYRKGELERSQPEIERKAIEEILFLLRNRKCAVYFLADRGFDAPEMLRFLEKYGIFYVVRASINTICFKENGRRFKISKRVLSKGTQRVLYNIKYSYHYRIAMNFYAIWRTDQREPWLLLSNIKSNVRTIASLYARRMTIEEMFKSMKDHETGFDIKKIRLVHLDRWLRLLSLSSLLLHLLAKVSKLICEYPRIEQRYSMSFPSKRRKYPIFSIYRLALEVIRDPWFEFKLIGMRLYVRFPGVSWITT
jgi:hypothetical protein